jgi:hypothetical protein
MAADRPPDDQRALPIAIRAERRPEGRRLPPIAAPISLNFEESPVKSASCNTSTTELGMSAIFNGMSLKSSISLNFEG